MRLISSQFVYALCTQTMRHPTKVDVLTGPLTFAIGSMSILEVQFVLVTTFKGKNHAVLSKLSTSHMLALPTIVSSTFQRWSTIYSEQ